MVIQRAELSSKQTAQKKNDGHLDHDVRIARVIPNYFFDYFPVREKFYLHIKYILRRISALEGDKNKRKKP